MLGIAVALVLGEVFAWWNSVVGWCIVGVAELILLQRKRRHRSWLLLPLIACIGLLRADDAMQFDSLEQTISEKTYHICLQGEVVWIQETASMWKIELTDLVLEEEKKREKYGNCIVYVEEKPVVEIGNRIQVQGEIELFQEAVNPGMYDQRAYYRAQNIRYCLWAEQCIVVNSQKDPVKQWIYELRCKLAEVLKTITSKEDTGIMQAVFLGEKSNLDADLKELYQKNGIAHILAVSGLHISCIGMVIYKLLRKISGNFGLAGVLSGIVIIAYIIMTGGSVSALRAGGMFLVLLIANGMGKVYDMASALSVSVIFILLFYPLQLFQCGFQLSVSTVAGIAVIAPTIYEGEDHLKWWKGLAVSCAIQFASIPILLWNFFTYPIYSILLNALILPFASILLVSVGSGAIVGLYRMSAAIFFIGSGHIVLKYYNLICEIFEQMPGAIQVIGRAKGWQIFVYFIVFFSLFVCLEKQTNKKRKNIYGILKPKKRAEFQKEVITAAGLLILLASALFLLRPIPEKELNITVLDVGQGDCSFLYFPDGTTMLIDGGSTTEKEVGAYRIEPFLYSQGIQSLDYVVLTHPDADHMNGIEELLASGSIVIQSLLLPNVEQIKEQYKEIILHCNRVIWMEKGMIWKSGDVQLQCLHPTKDLSLDDVNDCSVVLKLKYGTFSMLFMGDLGMGQEKNFVELQKTTILKVGHHGSKNSTSEQFLAQIRPDHAILSYGKENSYGHPHKEVVERLEKQNCHIWHTAKQGAIQIKVDEKNYSICGYKENKK